jgi:hypothetical protein
MKPSNIEKAGKPYSLRTTRTFVHRVQARRKLLIVFVFASVSALAVIEVHIGTNHRIAVIVGVDNVLHRDFECPRLRGPGARQIFVPRAFLGTSTVVVHSST